MSQQAYISPQQKPLNRQLRHQDVFPVSVRETKLFYRLKNIPRSSAKNGRFLVINGFYSQAWAGRGSVRQTYWLLYEQR
jgi:hypothetical protein